MVQQRTKERSGTPCSCPKGSVCKGGEEQGEEGGARVPDLCESEEKERRKVEGS